jgi:deoxyribose-phosphate aldolase
LEEAEKVVEKIKKEHKSDDIKLNIALSEKYTENKEEVKTDTTKKAEKTMEEEIKELLEEKEAKKAIADGADEIDMMAKISAIKNHEYHDVRDDIKAVKEAIGDTVLKVIIECPVLTMDEIAAAAAMCEDAGADYVKTASGFNGNQDFYSLMESLRVIKKNAPHCKMKAAGGINNYKLTTNIIAAGVEKIGSSNPLPIIDELNHVAGNQKVAPGTVKGPRLI